MTPDNVRNFKYTVSDETRTALGTTPEAWAFLSATEPPMPVGIALGLAQRADGEHVVAIRATPEHEEEASILKERAGGEADVKILRITKRSTPTYFQAVRRPLEPGCQIQMRGMPFVGTLGCFVKDENGILHALTNAHVASDESRATPGHPIDQPLGGPIERQIGLYVRDVPLQTSAPNLVDAALVRLDRRVPVMLSYDAAIPDKPLFLRGVDKEDLGRTVLKVGRTTGGRIGKITATEIDGLPVGYDRGTIRFNDQIEVSGGIATDFSAAGDSGSMIVAEDGAALGLLFAGGRDSTGEDRTYANRLNVACWMLGVELA